MTHPAWVPRKRRRSEPPRADLVALLEEGTSVRRPIEAEHIQGDLYVIIDQPYDHEIERWQFEPGDRVTCQWIESSGGRILVATSKCA